MTHIIQKIFIELKNNNILLLDDNKLNRLKFYDLAMAFDTITNTLTI